MLQMIQAAAEAAIPEAESARAHSPATTLEAAEAVPGASGVSAQQTPAAGIIADNSSVESESPQMVAEATGPESLKPLESLKPAGLAVAQDEFVEAAQAAMASLSSAAPKRKSMLRPSLSWRRSRASSRASQP